MALGDHIKVRRLGYSHHGIDMGDGTVIHFSGEPLRQSGACVCRVPIEDFLFGGKVVTVSYPTPTRAAEEVVAAAAALVGTKGYHLWHNNCEHFAWYCKTGRRMSPQIHRLAGGIKTGIVGTAAVVGVVGMAALRHRLKRRRGGII